MSLRNSAVFVLLVLVASGCGQKKLDAGKYVAWLSDTKNGFRKITELGDMTMDIQYMTPTMVALVEGNCAGSVSCDSMQKRNEEMYSFQYRVKGKNLADVFYAPPAELYGQRVNHASFNIQYDFTLISGSDTLSPSLYLLERNYGVTPYTVFLLKFQKPEKLQEKQDVVLVYNDRLFGLDKIVSRFKSSDISNEPKINWN